MAGFYQPAAKCGHTSVLVEEQLFVWAASRDLPEVHSSEEKLRATSYVDVFQSRLGTWKQHSTTGTPPLGVRGYASCSVDRDIIYFGGYCGHDTCYHNSMFGLGAENLVWREFLATSETSGPMRKGYCAVLQFDSRLLVIGGRGDEPPGDPSPSATYEIRDGLVYTNEHHLFHTLSAEWIIPIVTGDVPPPIADFSFTKIWSDRAALFGGCVLGGVSSELRLATVNWDNVHWQRVASRGPDHPMERSCHAATSFSLAPPDSQPSLLLLVGGHLNDDGWIWDVTDITWKRIVGLPDIITKRCDHSMSVISASGDCVWVMIIGGLVGENMSQVITLFELKLTSKGHWKVTSVATDEEIYSGYSERFSRTFPALMSALVHELHDEKIKSNEKELSQLLQESRQQLQFFQQQSAEKERMVVLLQQQLDETSSDRTQLRGALSELEKVKTLYRAQAFEKSILEQKLKKSLSSFVKKSESCDAAVQANYLSATKEGSEMEILASTVMEITGDRQQTFKWPGNGFRLTVPAGAVPQGTTISVAVRALLAKSFQLPEKSQLITVIYWVTTSQEFCKEVTMHMQHCAIIKNEAQCSRFRIVAGKYNKSDDCHPLKKREGGVFTPHTHEATYTINKYAFYAAVCDAGPEDTTTYYWGQAYYQQVGWGRSWVVDFVVTTYVDPILTWVQENYEGRGWTQHHENLLEYDKPTDENLEPTISAFITEPVDKQQSYWEVSMITPFDFKQSSVDALSDRAHLPFVRIGVQWRGPPGSTHYCFVRKIDLLGMTGPNNYFRIFLPDCMEQPEMSLQRSAYPAELTKVSLAKDENVLLKKRSGDEDGCEAHGKKMRTDSNGDAPISASMSCLSVSPATAVPQEKESLDEHDLQRVIIEVMSVRCIRSLGLALGLRMSTVEKIQRDHVLLEDQKIQVIYYWLQRIDIVPEKCLRRATWSELASAVASENASLSEHIQRTYCDRLA